MGQGRASGLMVTRQVSCSRAGPRDAGAGIKSDRVTSLVSAQQRPHGTGGVGLARFQNLNYLFKDLESQQGGVVGRHFPEAAGEGESGRTWKQKT